MADLVVAGAVAEADDGEARPLGGDERDVHRRGVGQEHGDPGLTGQAGGHQRAGQAVARSS